ncbi:MAG: hypothetical protein KDE32_10280 [Novosphingobium sp.]|nr:hypothetical protein [Novosphingobium sp.]
MEGETLSLANIDQRDDAVSDVDGERRYFLMSDGSPLQVNFNIKLDAIPASFPATFTLPADNNPNIKVDLNFFNQDRDSSRMKKRIVFSEGSIEVRAMSENALDISFKGAGHPLGAMKEMFPVEGRVSFAK